MRDVSAFQRGEDERSNYTRGHCPDKETMRGFACTMCEHGPVTNLDLISLVSTVRPFSKKSTEICCGEYHGDGPKKGKERIQKLNRIKTF